MNTLNGAKPLPFGAVTITLVVLVGLVQLWNYLQPVSMCDELKTKLDKGFFYQYDDGTLIVVTSDQQHKWVTGENEEAACVKMYSEFFQVVE